MNDRSAAWTAAALIATPALGLAALLSDPTGFPFWRGAAYSDLLISHWPIAAFIRQSLETWHQVPLWNPLILSGMPLAADPLAGLWYPPNVLAWVLPAGLGFNLLFWTHLGLAAWGVMRLLRSEGASSLSALLGGVAFAATPKLVGHVGLGHLTLVEAVCWTPWVLLAIRRAIEQTLEPGERRWRYGLAGAAVGLVFLVDPRWVIPVGLLSLAYGGKCLAHSQSRRARIAAGWKAGVAAAAIGLCVAAPAMIPLAELLPRTTRSAMPAEAALEMSLPPAQLLGAFALQAGGWPETQTYLGATIVVLIVCGAAVSMGRSRFWTAVLLVGILLALGAYTPLYELMMQMIPGMSSMRVPARFFLIVALAAAMLAAHALDRLREAGLHARAAHRVRLAAVGAGVLALALSVAVAVSRAGPPGAGTWILAWASVAGGVLACITAGCVLLLLRESPAARLAGVTILALVALDLGWANMFTLEVRPAEDALSPAACELAGDSASYGVHRIFSPSYSLPQQSAVTCGVELADGVNPLQLTAYRDAMAAATGFSAEAYSVTLPPFPSGDVRANWSPAIDAEALGMLNVDRIVSAYSLEAPGLALLAQEDGKWVYRNTLVRPRAWVAPAGPETPAWRPVEDLEWTPNRIRVRAVGPGRLVLSEIIYPGWQARMDGAAVPIRTDAGVLRSMDLPAGEHEFVLTFVPFSVYLGVALATLAILVLGLFKVRR
jgi:hypothetical protein